MHLFFHIALDQFGALCLGKFADYLADLSEPNNEHHFYIWAGIEQLPARHGFWDQHLPVWDNQLWGTQCESPYNQDAHGMPGIELDRNALANAISKSFKNPMTRGVLDEIFHEMPKRQFGNRTYQPALTFSASLADPSGSACLLGLLDGFRSLRDLGVHGYPSYVVAGIGEDTPSLSETEEVIRCLSGQALSDLEAFFNLPYANHSKAFPVYLVGEKPIGEVASDKETQASLAAATLLGITRSELYDGKWPDNHANGPNPFNFQSNTSCDATIGNATWDGQRPFHIVGAAVVRCPLRALSWLLAAEFSVQFWKTISCGNLPQSIEACALIHLDSQEQEAFITSLEKEARGTFWTSIEDVYTLKVLGDEAAGIERLNWFDEAFIEKVIGSVFKQTRWKKILDWYTFDRLKHLALEDWSSAVDELIDVIENGFIPQRLHHIEMVERRILQLYIDAIDKSINLLFQNTGRSPVNLSPHLCALKLLGQVRLNLNKVQNEIEHRERVNPKDPDFILKQAKKTEQRQRDALNEAIDAVPSPAAIFIRFIPLFIASAGVLYFFPYKLQYVDLLMPRWALGLAAGTSACLTLFWRHVYLVRRRLSKAFNIWFEAFKKLIDLQDKAACDQAHKNILSYMDKVIRWFVEGKTDEPPLPDKHRIHLRKPSLKNYWEDLPEETANRQSVLSKPQNVIQQARERSINLVRQLKANIFSSYAERLFPSHKLIDETMRDVLGTNDPDRLQRILNDIRGNWPVDAVRPMVPYSSAENGPESGIPDWRRTFVLPDERKLMNSDVQKKSSAFRFLNTLSSYFESTLAPTYSITNQVNKHLQDSGDMRLPGSELDKFLNDLSQPSVSACGGERDTLNLMLVSQVGDPIAAERNWSNNLGRNRLTVLYRIQLNRSASDILEYPNPIQPQTPLGKAWRQLSCQALPGKAFKPVSFKKDDV